MYGIQCDRCRAFTKCADAEGWGRIQKLTVSYDDCLEPKGDFKYLCPVCLDIVEEDFIE